MGVRMGSWMGESMVGSPVTVDCNQGGRMVEAGTRTLLPSCFSFVQDHSAPPRQQVLSSCSILRLLAIFFPSFDASACASSFCIYAELVSGWHCFSHFSLGTLQSGRAGNLFQRSNYTSSSSSAGLSVLCCCAGLAPSACRKAGPFRSDASSD
jgi:hypothetical protein